MIAHVLFAKRFRARIKSGPGFCGTCVGQGDKAFDRNILPRAVGSIAAFRAAERDRARATSGSRATSCGAGRTPAVTRSSAARSQGRGCAAGCKLHQRRRHWRRHERRGRDVEQDFASRAPAREHGRAGVGLRSGLCHDALGDLALEHQERAGHTRGGRGSTVSQPTRGRSQYCRAGSPRCAAQRRRDAARRRNAMRPPR